MQRYIAKRLLIAIPTLLGVTLIIASMLRLTPGDPVDILVTAGGPIAKKDIEKLRHQMGLDRPLHQQYFAWMRDLFRGNLGNSLWRGTPVAREIRDRLPVSLQLSLTVVIMSLATGVPLGVLAASRHSKPLDHVIRLLSIIGLSIPSFWTGTLMVVLLSIWFHWLPGTAAINFFDDPKNNLAQFGLAGLAIAFPVSAVIMRMTRTTLLEVLRDDYIRTARAKGLRDQVVLVRHALKNAMLPVLTQASNLFVGLIAGAVLIEVVFNLQGIGTLLVDAVSLRDYTVVQGVVLFIAGSFLFMNLVVDLLYAWIDPRIRYT